MVLVLGSGQNAALVGWEGEDNSPVAGNPFGMINAREDSEFRGPSPSPVRAY